MIEFLRNLNSLKQFSVNFYRKTNGHYKKTVSELTETGPNQHVLIDRKLTDCCHFGQISINLNNFLSIRTNFCQLSVN